MKIALVGGGAYTAEVLEKTMVDFFDHEEINARILAVADPDPEAPGMIKARQMGLITVSDYRAFYDPAMGIEQIIVLRPEVDVLYDILSHKPDDIRVLPHQTFKLFWDTINIEANKLRERNQEIEAIVDGIQDFILVLRPDMTIIEVNKEFLKQMGYAREEVIGRKCYEVFKRLNRRCNESNADVFCPLQETLTHNQPSQRVFPRVNAEGKVVYMEVSLYPIWEEDGSISKFVEISRDLTRRRKTRKDVVYRLEKEVEERTRELKKRQEQILHQDKMASLGKLSASMVHEINNPISGILNLTLLMKRILAEDSKADIDFDKFTNYLELMESETRRISRIASNLLSFSRESKMEMGPVDVNQLLEDLLFIHENFFKINRIKLDKRLEPGLPGIVADGEQIKQVFMNMISNAVAAREGQKGGTLSVVTESRHNRVRIDFIDTGAGIPKSELKRIFDPFYSTKKRDKGVGLGLSVAYGIVEQHCGSIDIHSEEGRGMTVSILLPLKQPLEKIEQGGRHG